MTDLTAPREIYEAIVVETPDGLDNQVLAVLQNHVGKTNRIKRADLVHKIFSPKNGFSFTTDSHDRQVRLAIARLRERYPILSSSGEGGYWIADGIGELVEYQREIVSRVRRLEAQANLVSVWAKQLQFNLDK